MVHRPGLKQDPQPEHAVIGIEQRFDIACFDLPACGGAFENQPCLLPPRIQIIAFEKRHKVLIGDPFCNECTHQRQKLRGGRLVIGLREAQQIGCERAGVRNVHDLFHEAFECIEKDMSARRPPAVDGLLADASLMRDSLNRCCAKPFSPYDPKRGLENPRTGFFVARPSALFPVVFQKIRLHRFKIKRYVSYCK